MAISIRQKEAPHSSILEFSPLLVFVFRSLDSLRSSRRRVRSLTRIVAPHPHNQKYSLLSSCLFILLRGRSIIRLSALPPPNVAITSDNIIAPLLVMIPWEIERQ